MSVYRILEEIKDVETLFKGWDETLIWSCLQGYMGTAWTDCKNKMESVQIVIADFCFFAGKPSEELVKHKPKEHRSDFVIMVPENKEWAELIKRVYEDDATQVIRYAIKKEPNIFDYNSLKKIVDDVSEEYKIKQITKDTFDSTRKNSWSRDLCSQFKDYDDYCEHGIGVVAIHNGEVVSGASSYTVYQGGIEIEIDTKEDYRRRGLALACGAKLILKCMDKNWYPSWDAQNKASVALAEKLGYHFDKEYIAYEVVGYGEK